MKIVLLNDLLINPGLYEGVKKDLASLGHTFTYYLRKPRNDEEIVKRIKDADILITDNTKLSEEVLKQAKNLKYIDVAFTGYDHIPLEFCKANKINVSNCSGYATEAVAELNLAFILSLLRDIKANDTKVRKSKTHNNQLGEELDTKVVGVIGTGKIGARLIDLLQPFNLRVLAYSKTIKKNIVSKGVTYVDLKDIMSKSDFICLTLPLNDETKNLIGEREIALMKPTAYLINTARGGIVDENALINALKEKKIKGAALDVFSIEPPLSKDNELLKLDNVLLSPHIGYMTKEAMKKRAEIAFSNLYSYLEGKIKNKII